MLVTHDNALAQRCDRIVRLRSGRIESARRTLQDSTASIAHASNRLPLWLKLAYTAFMAVLVPVYWHYYGPTNFLYFCDVALFLTLAGIWLESPLLDLDVRGRHRRAADPVGASISCPTCSACRCSA